MNEADREFICEAIYERFPDPTHRLALGLGVLTVAASEIVGELGAEKLAAAIKSQLATWKPGFSDYHAAKRKVRSDSQEFLEDLEGAD